MSKLISALTLIGCVCVMVCTTACSTTRAYPYSYDKVKSALAERFYKYQWSPISTEYASFKEPKAGTILEIDYYDWQFPNTKIYMQIEVERIDQNNCEVSIFVKDHDSWFHPWGYYTSMQHNVADALLRRLQNGTWDPLGYETMRMMQPTSSSYNRQQNPPPFSGSGTGTQPPAFGGGNNASDIPPAFIE